MASTEVTQSGGGMQTTTSTAPATGQAPKFHPSRVLVKFRNGARAFLPGSGTAKSFKHDADVFVVDTPPGLSVAAAVGQYKNSPNVVYAEPDYEVSIVATPNDTLWANQWDMTKISADTAWSTQTNSTGVVVAIIDTGINETHPDLAANVLPGYNCINASSNIPVGCKLVQADDHGHGTHVAGTIGAMGNNGVGIAGINWSAKMMAFKFLNSGGSGYVSDAMYAFNKIVELKAAGTNFRVTNNSWGGGGYDQALKDAMAAAEAVGIVNVCAAGNSGVNADISPMFPGGYDNRGIVSVLASDSTDLGASFTNYGVAAVDIAAPGVNTLSTVPTGSCSLCDATGYKYLSGTSMASPHVAGAVAAMIQRNMTLNGGVSNLTAAMARDVLLDPSSYDVMTDAKAKSTSTGGRVNIAKLFSNPKLQTPPAQLNNFPTLTVGSNIFASAGQLVTLSATANDADAADNANLRMSFGKPSSSSWLFGSMENSLFPAPSGNPSSFTAPTIARADSVPYLASVTDNRGGGDTKSQIVTVNPIAGPTGPPDGAFSICQANTANCAGSGGAINVTRTISCGTGCLEADITVNYSPVDPDNKGTPLWDSFYSSTGSAGGSCCYGGSATTWRFTSAGVWRMSVNSVDRYLETSPTGAANRKTAVVRVDSATGTPPIGAGSVSALSGPVPFQVTVDLTGSTDPDGTVTTYFVSCGEGVLYSQSTPSRVCTFNTPGSYWLESFVQDNQGLWDVVNLYVVATPVNGGGGDNVAPSVSMTAPAAGNVKGTITVSATAADNVGGSGMKEVKFYRDNGVLINPITGAGPYSFSWNSATVGDGAHTLYAVATDNLSNSATSGTISITVDNTAPAVSVSAPTGGTTVYGTIAVSAIAGDTPGSGVASVTFWLDGVGSGVNLGSDSTSPYSVNWNTTATSNAGHTLTAVALDSVGFSTTSAVVNITVDNSIAPPSIGSLSFNPAVAKKASVTITANGVTGGGGTISKVDFYVNGAVVGTDNNSSNGYTATWKVPAAGGRSYTVTAVVTDSLGRTATSQPYNFNP